VFVVSMEIHAPAISNLRRKMTLSVTGQKERLLIALTTFRTSSRLSSMLLALRSSTNSPTFSMQAIEEHRRASGRVISAAARHGDSRGNGASSPCGRDAARASRRQNTQHSKECHALPPAVPSRRKADDCHHPPTPPFHPPPHSLYTTHLRSIFMPPQLAYRWAGVSPQGSTGAGHAVVHPPATQNEAPMLGSMQRLATTRTSFTSAFSLS